jgi:hypothetical protein
MSATDLVIKQPWKLLGFIWALPLTLLGLLWAVIIGAGWMYFLADDWTFHFICHPSGRGEKLMTRFNVGAWGGLGLVCIFNGPPGPKMQLHERWHCHQARKFGIFFPLMAALSYLLAWAFGQDIYRGADLEEQARFEAGEVPMPDDIKPKDHTGGRL